MWRYCAVNPSYKPGGILFFSPAFGLHANKSTLRKMPFLPQCKKKNKTCLFFFYKTNFFKGSRPLAHCHIAFTTFNKHRVWMADVKISREMQRIKESWVGGEHAVISFQELLLQMGQAQQMLQILWCFI